MNLILRVGDNKRLFSIIKTGSKCCYLILFLSSGSDSSCESSSDPSSSHSGPLHTYKFQFNNSCYIFLLLYWFINLFINLCLFDFSKGRSKNDNNSLVMSNGDGLRHRNPPIHKNPVDLRSEWN